MSTVGASNEASFDGGSQKRRRIDHVFVLMLENRSFDNALGYLDAHHPFYGLHPPTAGEAGTCKTSTSSSDGGSGGQQQAETDSKAAEDPRRQRQRQDVAKTALPSMNKALFNSVSSTEEGTPGEEEEKVWPEPRAQFYTPVDPPHSHKEIMEQMFGEGRVPSFPSTTQPTPDMSGFLSWYKRRCGEWRYPHKLDPDEHHKVMHAYTPADLPVLSTLAREYAFSDSWFCSMPGPTAPNRQFLHSATSAGHTANSGRSQHQPTVFDMLDAAEKPWRVYYHDIPSCLTFSRALARPDFAQRFVRFDDRFESDLAHNHENDDGDDDAFPAYCFIEPRIFDDPVNGLYSNDQHPPHDVRRGEALLARVYEALRRSPRWETSLLVVLYDEHGGYYDHVPPPYVRSRGSSTAATAEFDFSLLGPRVPAVFVSPQLARRQPPVRPRSPDQYFTHESLILTLAKMWDLDASVLEWQHDPAQIATFEWLWEDAPAAESHKEDVRLPSWRDLEAASVAFEHEGMDPYEANYEVKWVGWAVALALFVRDDVQAADADVRRWCDGVIALRDTLSAYAPFQDGFKTVVDRTRRQLADACAATAELRAELAAVRPSSLLPLLLRLDAVAHS